MAHTKSGGSTKLGRDSIGKRLGVKVNDGEAVNVGEIIIRQRGTHYLPGRHVGRAHDDSLYARRDGIIKFLTRKKIRFDGSTRFAKMVTIVPRG